MSRSFSRRSRCASRNDHKRPIRSKPILDRLEDRLAPAGNLLVTTAGSYPQQFLKEYTPSGSLVRTVNVPPPPGLSSDTARDLVQDAGGKVYVYNGTFTPALATYNPGTSAWTQQQYTGWSTVNNGSYGGVGLYQNYVFASDMTVGGDPVGQSNGIVRFDLTTGTATRFASGIDTIDVNVGLDGLVYSLAGQTVRVYDPNTLALIRSVTLPYGNDYRGVTANAAGEIFTANWGNTVTRFTPAGALVSSVTLTGPGDGYLFGNLTDIDVASDGTLAVGTRFGHVVQMTSALTNVTYFRTFTGSSQYSCFVSFAAVSAPPPPTVDVADFSAAEGNSGTTVFQVPATLSSPSSVSVTATYSITNGTATSGSDFVGVSSQTVTFAAGQTTAYIPVTVYGDTTLEPNETVTVRVFGVSGGATIGRGTGLATILNDDVPTITINNQGIYEGSTGSANANFQVYLSGASTQTVTVNYVTLDGTATAGSDYSFVSGQLTFAPGQTTAYVSVPVYGDTVDEADELYYVSIYSPVNATLANSQGRGTIINDDLTISVADAAPVTEGNSGSTPATFTVSLSAPSTHTVTVGYYTNGGTATAGSDYISTNGTLTFNPGVSSITVPVSVLGDTTYEADETFSLWISQASHALINRISGSTTIVNDDPSTMISVSDASVLEGNSGLAGATFTVALNAASTQTVTVNYATAGGTATSGTDFQSLTGSLSFAPGQTSKTVTVYAVGDTVIEPNETFTLNLSSPINASINDGQGIGTILDDDSPGLSVGNATVVEGNTGTVYATFAVTLSPTSTQTVTVRYATASGTATSGSDFTSTTGTLTFYAGQSTAYVNVPVTGDLNYETDETFTLNLSNPVNSAIRYGTGTGTITNDDGIPSLSVTDITNSESNYSTTTGYALVSLSASSYQPITFTYSTANGTALAGVDYAASSGTLTVNPGSTGYTIPITLYGDTTPEPTKAFLLNVSSVTNATIARPQGTVTIANDDGPTVSIYGSGVTEGNSGSQVMNLTVQLSAPATQTTTVDYATSDGSTQAGLDYQATSGTLTFNPGEMTKYVPVLVYGDTLYEQNDFFYMRLSNAAYCVIGGTNYNATAYINNDDAAPALSVNDVSVVEGNIGSTYAVFTVSLSAVSGLPATTYYQTVAGTAASNADYAATYGYLYIPAGQSSLTVSVPVYGDTFIEANETFVLNLYSPSSATLGRPNGTGTIVNDDFPVISAAAASVVEGNAGTTAMTFTLSLSAASQQTVTVNYAAIDLDNPLAGGGPPRATGGVDYEATSGTVTFAAGQTTATVTVQIYGDTAVEQNEQFGLLLSDPVNATLATLPGNFGTILNDDAPAISVGDASITEGDAGTTAVTFTVNLDQPGFSPVTVHYATADGTAAAGSDYEAASGDLTFAAGQTQKTVTVLVNGDTLNEVDEAFFVDLSSPTNATLARPRAMGTILNDDPLPSLSIGDVSITEGNSGTTAATFTVSLSAASGRTVTVNYVTFDGTATTGSDFSFVSGTLAIAPGQTSGTISVPVNGDRVAEAAELFHVSLFSAVNATLADGSADGTIVNDDHTPVAVAGPNQTADEGSLVTFDASGSSDADGDTLTYFWGFGDGSGGAGVSPTHTYGDNGTYTVTLTVSDGVNSSTSSLTVTVQNVAPTAGVTGDSAGVAGQERSFIFIASDPSAADQAGAFTYEINWGDGSTHQVAGAASLETVTHVFTAVGSYTVTATAKDKDGGISEEVSRAVFIVTAELQAGDLVVGGTTGDDIIAIQPIDENGTLGVVINGVDQGGFSPGGRVVVFGQAGNDVIQVSSVALPVILLGGNGDDTLDASTVTGPAVLSGEAGNDVLWGGSGRNVLLGGIGADELHGGADEDLLVGAATSHDADLPALLALLAEWSRTDADYETRLGHLDGSLAGGLNGTTLLDAQSLTSDDASDHLFGQSGRDWFFAAPDGATADVLNDWEDGEVVTPI